MKLNMYQIDAFASQPFEGNPAAVCPLETWLPDETMQAIASENNLSETVFFVPQDVGFSIRWFTPTVEVKLCGHATLAAAYVLFYELGYKKEDIVFSSRSGDLSVKRVGQWLELDFPLQTPVACPVPQAITDAFGIEPQVCLKAEDYLVIFEHANDVLQAEPDLPCLKQLDLRGVIITAKSDSYDFVTRFFAPNYGIDEDPVTGSAFTQLIPYWSEQLGKSKLSAKQVSKRGGEVLCELTGQRVKISGKAVKYLEGTIDLISRNNV